MKLSDFKYKINDKLIAQYPVKPRDAARLMILNRKDKTISEGKFKDIIQFLEAGDCLVVNETKVFSARLMGYKEKTDAEVEIFLLRELENNLWEVLVKPARKVRIGNRLIINGNIQCDVIDNTVSGGRVVRFNYDNDFYKLVEEIGQTPLPPYIKREPEVSDKQNYQTVFANVRGAVAAPTAGLHFTPQLVERIKKKGVQIVPVLLHVGLGTFRPVMVEDLTRHRMDSEYFEVYAKSAEILNTAKKNKKKIIAVGTTAVRTLESAVTSDGMVKPAKGWTDKFIYPPYDQPASTLLMLVSAFSGRDFLFKAYRKAIKDKYRFFSYGDAMLIL